MKCLSFDEEDGGSVGGQVFLSIGPTSSDSAD